MAASDAKVLLSASAAEPSRAEGYAFMANEEGDIRSRGAGGGHDWRGAALSTIRRMWWDRAGLDMQIGSRQVARSNAVGVCTGIGRAMSCRVAMTPEAGGRHRCQRGSSRVGGESALLDVMYKRKEREGGKEQSCDANPDAEAASRGGRMNEGLKEPHA